MSGIGSVLLAAAGTVWSVPSWMFWGMGAILFVVASFRVWLNERKALEKAQEQLRSIEQVPLSSGLFTIQHAEHRLGVRDERGGFGGLPPSSLKPTAGTLMLQVAMSITAIPSRLVEGIELELTGKRIPSNWESREVYGVSGHPPYIYFDVPAWVNSGVHKVKLAARDSRDEVLSSEFEVSIPQQA